MANEEQYQWTDNPTESGVALCDTDVLNDCLMHLKYDKKEGNGYEVGDIVIRNTPTKDASKHLLDGALIQYGIYQEFVDYIADLYNNTPTEDVFNVNIVGSLTNNDGVLSGFNTSNYATLPYTFNPSNSNWEVVVPITTASSFVNCDFFASVVNDDFGIHAQLNAEGKIYLYLSSNGTSHDIAFGVAGASTLSVNTKYWIKIVFNGTSYNVYSSTTGEFNGEEITQIMVNNSAALCTMTTTVLGRNPNPSAPNPFNGSIDLNEAYININGQRWWGDKSEKRAGFLTEDEWQATVTTYGVCGKFVYDSENKTVRLPKITGKIDGTTDVNALGDLVEQYVRLPNITGSWATVSDGTQLSKSIYQIQDNSGALFDTRNSGGWGTPRVLGFDASKSSSVYSGNGSNTKIHEQAINVFYYIVIATSTKTDIQVDIDEIATDLNGKADVDLTNCTRPYITESYVNGASGYNIYSNGYCEQWGIYDRGGDYGKGDWYVTLLIPYANNNYFTTAAQGGNSVGGGYGAYVAVNNVNKTISTFSGYVWITEQSNRYINWQTKGYIG